MNMKSIKIFAIAAGLLALAACTKEQEITSMAKLDASKPAVASLSYDDATSGANAAGFTWSADAALKAGATSFTLELATDISVESVENASKFKVVNAPEVAYIMTGLTKGAFYYARIRANYPGFLFSNWTYLGSKDSPLAVCVGTGPVDAKFGAPANLKTSNIAETGFKASWDPVPFATSYTFEYKAASSGEWQVVGDLTATSYDVEGLVGLTSYDIRVKAVKGEQSSDYTTGSVTTLEPSKFKPNMTKPSELIEFLTSEASLASSANEYTLEADIDLAGADVPSVENFKGILDGKGHSIKGLKSGKPLFATLTGTVKNLVIDAGCEFTPEVAFFGIIAGDNKGTISGVTNKAAVAYTADAVAEPMLVAAIAGQSSGEIADLAGIVGYQAAGMSGCINKGAISFNGKNISSKVTVIDAEGALPTIGGVAGYGAPGFSMSNCENHGKVTYALMAADVDLTANLNRNQMGGIVGSPCGSVTGCKNFAEVNISIKNSTPGTNLPKEVIACVGGIGGGDYLFTNTSAGPFSNTSYINCVNEGNIIVDSDASASNSAIGGIVGWPGQEKPATGTSCNGCVNKGNVTGKGAMKCRLGGIEGGTGIIENCENQGVITLESGAAGSALGSICGFHSQGHAIVGCIAGGEVVTKIANTGGTGGLVGNLGNVAHDTGTGCKVTCKITADKYDAGTMGAVVGYFNGTSQVVVLGSPSDPIKLAGCTINGNPVTPETVCGSKNPDNHTINYSL